MTMAEEIVEPKRVSEVSVSPRLGSPLLSPHAIVLPKNEEELREVAKRLAFSVVTAFIEHDRGHFEESTEGFFQVFLPLFPNVGLLKVHSASELFVKALFKQDDIENHSGHGSNEIINDGQWEEVKALLITFSRTIGIPDSFAESTTNFWRYHGVGDDRYVNYLLQSDEIMTSAILGNSYWSKILSSLYLACVDCHDKHDSAGLETGLSFATKYYEIILKAKMTSFQVQSVGSQPRRNW
jgi:hypothetical protein